MSIDFSIENDPPDLGRDLMMAQPVITDWLQQDAFGKEALDRYRTMVGSSSLSGKLDPHPFIRTVDTENADLYASVTLLTTLLEARTRLGRAECDHAMAENPEERTRQETRKARLAQCWQPIRETVQLLEATAATMHGSVNSQLRELDTAHQSRLEGYAPLAHSQAYAQIERQCGELNAHLGMLRSAVKRDKESHGFIDQMDNSITDYCLESLIPRINKLSKILALNSIPLPGHWPNRDEGSPTWADAETKAPSELRRGFRLTSDEAERLGFGNVQNVGVGAQDAKIVRLSDFRTPKTNTP